MWGKRCNMLFFFLILLLPITSYADEFKPSHYCSRPSKPFSLDSQFEVDVYNSSIRSYKMCIEDFIDKQKEAIDQHRRAMKNAVEEWNDFVRYNR